MFSPQGVEEQKYTPPVGRILALASRLLCLTRSRLGGEGERGAHITTHSIASTTPSPSSVVSVPPPRPPATAMKVEGVTKVPVTAAVAEAPPAEPKDVGEEVRHYRLVWAKCTVSRLFWLVFHFYGLSICSSKIRRLFYVRTQKKLSEALLFFSGSKSK